MAIRRPLPTKEKFPVSKYHGVAMSEADYLALPEEKPYLEYVDGVVVQKPMPDDFQRKIVRYLDYLFEIYIRAHGGDGGPEGRMRLPDGSGYRLPDAALWVAGRYSGKDSVPSAAFEIRSESQSMPELRTKCRTFRRNGVDVCFLIDPYARTAEVFDADRDGERVSASATLESAALPGFSVSVSDLFAVLDR